MKKLNEVTDPFANIISQHPQKQTLMKLQSQCKVCSFEMMHYKVSSGSHFVLQMMTLKDFLEHLIFSQYLLTLCEALLIINQH